VTQPTGDQVAAVYAASADRTAAIVQAIDEAQLSTPVPSCPEWTVVEVLSHLVGGAADVVSGNTAGAPGPAWTQTQVEGRRGRQVSELLEEWAGVREPILAVCRSGAVPALAFDAMTHEQDIRGALGLERVPDRESVSLVAHGLAAGAVGRAAKAELPPLRIADDSEWSVGEPGGTTLTAPTFDLFRLLMGRRSASQASAMDWNADPAPYLDLLSPFGALRDTDVTE
jgi:uncharacterized protein (TIGR03083 family)